jgi:Type III secretion system, cytoplasmic E component of needle
MDKTVRQRLEELEQRLGILNSRIMEEEDARKRNELQRELRAVESAITLYRSTLEVESRVRKVEDTGTLPPA